MTYYVIKVYGLVCDGCEHSEEHAPYASDRAKLTTVRHVFANHGWTYRDGKDWCPKCSQKRSAT